MPSIINSNNRQIMDGGLVAATVTTSNAFIKSNDTILRELNDAKAMEYLPVIIYMAVLLVVGTIGNGLVCWVYWTRKRKSSSDYFILSMAILDLLTCIFGMPTEIADLRFPYMFYSPTACKLLRFFESATILSSVIILIEVAFDRYFRICNISKVFGSAKTKKLCIGAIVFGVLISWPTAVIFGKKTAETGIPGLTGIDCSTDDSIRDTIYPLLWYGFLCLSFVISFFFLTVIYILIGAEVWKRKNLTIGQKVSANRWPQQNPQNGSPIRGPQQPSSLEDSSLSLSGENANTRNSSVRSTPKQPKNRTTLKPRRTTLVLFIVTLAFVLSFVPFLIVMVLRNAIKDFEEDLSSAVELVYKFCLKSFFINNSVNPIIYSFLNENFRRHVSKQVKKVFKPCCRKQGLYPGGAKTPRNSDV